MGKKKILHNVPSALLIQLSVMFRSFTILNWKAYGLSPPSRLTSSSETVEYVDRPMGMFFLAAAREVAFSPSG